MMMMMKHTIRITMEINEVFTVEIRTN